MRKEPPGGEELAVAAPHCYCGRLARLQTSWTESNPLRRFFVCPKSEVGFGFASLSKSGQFFFENVMELLFECRGGKTVVGFLYGLILKCLAVREL